MLAPTVARYCLLLRVNHLESLLTVICRYVLPA